MLFLCLNFYKVSALSILKIKKKQLKKSTLCDTQHNNTKNKINKISAGGNIVFVIVFFLVFLNLSNFSFNFSEASLVGASEKFKNFLFGTLVYPLY